MRKPTLSERVPEEERPECFRARVLEWVKSIPEGKVATYGDVASALGSPRASRAVGAVLRGLGAQVKEGDVPWHRVINARGKISAQNDPHRGQIQRILLEDEGVCFDAKGRCDLSVLRWQGQVGRQ